ncbi:MAG: alpha/beta hydrolase fold domain-containing protein, partial [Paracoccus sp. (in: a-proteobacteria)]|nr:alpha/beta hydrolase fold domain-containing protein [Paracoccus sp. (in: a-proteobacteria)]
AAGAIANGWAVLVPAYPLAPPARISEMTRAVAERITEAARHVAGPVVITGHSAGGHLAARMACEGVLPDDVARRVRHVMPISALFDLRVFLGSRMNETLGLTCKEADAESPALLRPISGTRLTSWVGGAERAEFLRQSALLPNIWTGLGAETEHVIEPDRHHFNVVEGLEDGAHPMTRRLLGLDHRP